MVWGTVGSKLLLHAGCWAEKLEVTESLLSSVIPIVSSGLSAMTVTAILLASKHHLVNIRPIGEMHQCSLINFKLALPGPLLI